VFNNKRQLLIIIFKPVS